MRKLNGFIPVSEVADTASGLSQTEAVNLIRLAFSGMAGQVRKVLLLPPDATRPHSQAGLIASTLYALFSPAAQVDVLPALGTHVKMEREDWEKMYGVIPYERMLIHNWRDEVRLVGEIPGKYVREISSGLMDTPVPVELNHHILDPSYDLIVSIGQVVPHEVAGMANHAKNLFVGCGGAAFINASHMLGAVCGLENLMGRDRTPVRALFDYASEHFIKDLPLCYALSVTSAVFDEVSLHGLFIGQERKTFEDAVALSQKKNIFYLDKPVQKCVVSLDENEFHSTWLGNKAVYRTRMAIEDGGELIILAPGIKRFGEDKEADKMIRKYGYCGREKVLSEVKTQEDLKQNLSAAAHLIHGSSEGRFNITYCTSHLKKDDIEGVGYRYRPYEEAVKEFSGLKPGYNVTQNGEEIYYIQNPALGLWMVKE
ncbi:MAG: lactate racemase domain-containing protein [Bacillota bacterium]|nr:lactate racemase domain-containing protein [Bacillota bacterium]